MDDPNKQSIIEQIYKCFENGESCATIARKVNKSHDYVWNLLKKKGYRTQRNIMERLSTEEQAKICEMYKKRIPTSEILKQFPFIKTQNTIIKVVRNNGIEIRRPGAAPRIENEDFFEDINTEQKAYILGLLIADGAVIYPNKKSPVWTITLNDRDAYLLYDIVHIIGIDKKICHTRNESVLTVTSQKMVDDLKKYGVVPRKSFKSYFPFEVDSIMYPHLIRGIFDGDGGISKNICYFYGCYKMMEDLQEVLFQEIGLRKRTITVRPTNGADSFAFSAQKDLIAFYHYIYDDATIWMKRKKDKFYLLECIKSSITNANTVVT